MNLNKFHIFSKVRILSDNGHGDWCRGQLRTGQIGWLPRSCIDLIDTLDKYPWYHGKISRIRADIILNSGINGSFLVRESETNADQLSLCIRFGERAYHYKIMKNSNGGLYISDVMMFTTLAELVHHHSQHTYGLVTTLHYPAPKSDKSTTCGTHQPDEWEIDRGEICIIQQFNVEYNRDLYEGLWTKHQRKVAVKALKVTSSASELVIALICSREKLQGRENTSI